ncbi:putative angiopoietin-4 isoform X2, partial [Apostichopus japonicus]
GQSQYAEYTEFAIESKTTKYRMNKLVNHSGNAGTELSRSKGSSFSTHDNDNDGCSSFNCAEKNKSGWWHMDDWCSDCFGYICSCFQVHSCYYTCTGENLNGVYNGGSGQNIFSSDYEYCDIKFVEMKIPPTS